MVEVGLRKSNEEEKKNAEKILESIVEENLMEQQGRKVYTGHCAEYTDKVLEIRKAVQQGKFKPEDLKTRKSHWHSNFNLRLVDNLEQHNYVFATLIYANLAKHTKEGRNVIWITPVGPMGHYPVIAELMNTIGDVVGERVFPFAMDEWSSREGGRVSKEEYPYVTSFQEDMNTQFYSLLRGKSRIPEKNLHFAAEKGLCGYEKEIDNLLAREAAVIYTGGVGKIGHIAFWESTFGKRLGKDLSEKVLWIRGAPLTYGTIDQNETTSSGSAPVPKFANTTGMGLFVKMREYGEKNPGLVRAYFGLDNDEEPLKWQRFITQCMLAINKADASFGASYVPTMPGAYIIVKSHVEKNFSVPSK